MLRISDRHFAGKSTRNGPARGRFDTANCTRIISGHGPSTPRRRGRVSAARSFFCVETEVGPHCLRGWPPEADAERIAGLHRLLEHVRSRGIDFVAVPRAGKRRSDSRFGARTPLAIGAVAPRTGRLLGAVERCAVDGGDDRARPSASGDEPLSSRLARKRRGSEPIRIQFRQPSRNESSESKAGRGMLSNRCGSRLNAARKIRRDLLRRHGPSSPDFSGRQRE